MAALGINQRNGDAATQHRAHIASVSASPAARTIRHLNKEIYTRSTKGVGDNSIQEYAATRAEEISPVSFAQWIGRDPRAAARYAESLSPEQVREDALRLLATKWAASDSRSATAWADNLKNTDERSTALAAVFGQIAESNPAEAVQSAAKFLTDDQGTVVANLAQQWAAVDLPSALAWALSRPQNLEHEQVLERMTFVLAKKDPSAAANLAATQIPPGPIQVEALIMVLHQWAARDFDAALAWVSTSPSGLQLDRAIDELAGVEAEL
jgi:hypothetical protein